MTEIKNIQATLNWGRARQVGGEDAEAMGSIVDHPNPSILTTPCIGFASLRGIPDRGPE